MQSLSYINAKCTFKITVQQDNHNRTVGILKLHMYVHVVEQISRNMYLKTHTIAISVYWQGITCINMINMIHVHTVLYCE